MKIVPKYREAHYESNLTRHCLGCNLPGMLAGVRLGGNHYAADRKPLGPGEIQSFTRTQTARRKAEVAGRSFSHSHRGIACPSGRLVASGIATERYWVSGVLRSRQQCTSGSRTFRQLGSRISPEIQLQLGQRQAPLLAACWHADVSFKPRLLTREAGL